MFFCQRESVTFVSTDLSVALNVFEEGYTPIKVTCIYLKDFGGMSIRNLKRGEILREGFEKPYCQQVFRAPRGVFLSRAARMALGLAM